MAIHRWVAAVTKIPCTQATESGHDLVKQAEMLALSGLDKPLHISALCRALAVSERTLRKAFHRRHGIPPCRHLRMLRLSQARRALLSADGQLVTVTEIATGFGFGELGRFSVEYRKVFGESPSQTLQCAYPEQLFESADDHRDRRGFGAGGSGFLPNRRMRFGASIQAD